ncbi:MAG: hypothetical protein QME74_06530 [Candidatus Edwardsbacteria bacterium]|nr:hypothetical protein [Candidatus Edwardsbacteria bacterium]
MKRIILLLAAIILLVSPYAFATESRVSSLAGASNYLLDDSQIYSWPCRAPLFYRAVIAELGVDGSRISSQSSVSALYANQEQTFGVIGLAVNRRTDAQSRLCDYIYHTYTTGGVPVQANVIDRLKQNGWGRGSGLREIPVPGGGLEMLYAKKLGDWTPGLRIERCADENTENITGSAGEAASSVTGITLSAGYEPKDALRADLSLAYAGYSFSSRFTLDAAAYEEKFESDGARMVAGQALVFYDLNDEMTLVPRLSISYANLGYAYTQSDTSRNAEGKTSTLDLVLGSGWRYMPGPKYTVAAALEIGHHSSKTVDSLIMGEHGDTKSAETRWDLPTVHLGLETQLTRWLNVRIGGSKYVSSTEIKTDYSDQTSNTKKLSSDRYQLGCGMGIRIGGFLLDLTVNPELLYSGGNVLSGSKTWPVNQVSILYRF